MLDEVEAAIYLVAASILRGEGFSYDIPSRAKGNQVCKIEAASVRGHIWATFWGAWYDRVCMTSAMLSCCPVSLMYQGCRSVDCKARTSGQWHAATQGKVWLRYDSQWVCSQDACTLYIHHAWGGCWQYGNVLLSVQLYVPPVGPDCAARRHQPAPLRQHQHLPESRCMSGPTCAPYSSGAHPQVRPTATTYASAGCCQADTTGLHVRGRFCMHAVFTTRVLGLVHELCMKRIHVTKRDLFYTDVKLFEARLLPGCKGLSVAPCTIALPLEPRRACRVTTTAGSRNVLPQPAPGVALLHSAGPGQLGHCAGRCGLPAGLHALQPAW